jgi:hypothetical protein
MISFILLSILFYVASGNISLFKSLIQTPFEQWQLLAKYLLCIYIFSVFIYVFYDCFIKLNPNELDYFSDIWKEYKRNKEQLLSQNAATLNNVKLFDTATLCAYYDDGEGHYKPIKKMEKIELKEKVCLDFIHLLDNDAHKNLIENNLQVISSLTDGERVFVGWVSFDDLKDYIYKFAFDKNKCRTIISAWEKSTCNMIFIDFVKQQENEKSL